MKLNQNYQPATYHNIDDEGHDIFHAARKAYLSGDLERGWHLTSQLSPMEARYFYAAHTLGSQLNAFSLKLEEATRIARILFEALPEIPEAAHQLILALTYERKIDEAWNLQGWIARNHPGHLNHHQNACLLAASGDQAQALRSLRECLIRSPRGVWNKIWYDPELYDIWEHAAGNDVEPAIAAELQHPVWIDLLHSFDPQAPFDMLDPGNLLGYDTDQLNLIAYNPARTFGYLMDEDAVLDRVAYSKTYKQLSQMRHTSFMRLKLAQNLFASQRWQSAFGELEPCE